MMDILVDPVTILRKYLQIDTTNSQNDHLVCEFWSAIFSRYHVKHNVVHSGDYHNFETHTGSKAQEKILLQNHLDVVPAKRENWDYDPFSGEIVGDYLYGRGALDMKSIAVAQAYAFLRLVAEGHPLSNLIKFCSLVQEETTSENGAAFYVNHLNKMGYNNLLVLGEGGFTVTVPEIFNGRLFLYESEQKGMLWLQITVHSQGGHASLSGKSNLYNPIIRAIKVAQKLSNYRFPIKLENSISSFIENLFACSQNKLIRLMNTLPSVKNYLFETISGKYLLFYLISRATGIPDLFRTSLSITNIHTDKIPGLEEKVVHERFSWKSLFRRHRKHKLNPITRIGINIIPSYATITCDIRFNSFYTVKSMIDTIKQIIPHDAGLQVIDSHEYTASPYSIIHPILRKELQKNYGDRAMVSPFLFIASSDNYFFRSHGHHCFGLVPILTPIDELQRIHGDNERIHLKEFKEGCKVYYRLLKALVENTQT